MKGKTDEPLTLEVKVVLHCQVTIDDSTMNVKYSFDDMIVLKKELVEVTKKRKRLEDSGLRKQTLRS